MLDINKMLRKKKWTGAQVGQLELANMSYNYKKAKDTGNPTVEPLIPNEKFQKMLATLTEPEQGAIYNGYIAIHRWINETLQLANTQLQQANFRYFKFANQIMNALTAEDLYKYMAELPYMMTEKEYKDTVEKRTQELLKIDGETAEDNVLELLFNALDYYLAVMNGNPEANTPLTPLKEKLELEPVTDKHILEKYNKIMGLGYYELPDGTRSDMVTEEEWQKKQNPLMYKATHGELTGEEKTAIAWQRQLRDAQLMYEEGLDHREASSKRHEEEMAKGYSIKPEWHTYEKLPENISKWDILSIGGIELEDEYYNAFDVSYEEALESCKAFKKDFPTVVETLLTDMGERYPELKLIKDLPIEKWPEVTYSWEELYKMNFYAFRDTRTSDSLIFDGNKRALENGIAIVKPTDSLLLQRRIDENGYYKPPVLWEGKGNPLSLERYFPEGENSQFLISEAQNDRKTILSSLYFLKGYNKTLDLIADMYKVEEIKIFKVSTATLEEQIEALNHSIHLLYGQIKDTDYEDKELQEKKLKVLKDYFQPIDLSVLELPKAKIAQAKKDIKDFKAFRGQATDPYITLGIYDPESAKKGG